MKVLMSIMPAQGHINLAQPIAHELVTRGHAVLFLTGPAYQRAVELTGATFHALSVSVLAALEKPLSTSHYSHNPVVRLTDLFIRPIAPLIAQFREIHEFFAPDIVLADLMALAAHVWRELGGPINVSLSVNPLYTMAPEMPRWGSSSFPAQTVARRCWNRVLHWLVERFVMARVNAAFNDERRRLGLSVPARDGDAYPRVLLSRMLHLVPTTRAFEFPRRGLGAQVRFVGPLLPVVEGGWERPVWWEEMVRLHAEGKKKVVHVTQGTFATDSSNLIRPTIRALASEKDVLLIVTSKDSDAMAQELDFPSNVRLAKLIPHQELLKYVDVMVTNGGYGGVLTALSMGVPLVGAGLTEDKAMVNARIAWAGVGVDLRSNTPSERKIREGVRRVLDDERFEAKARLMQEDFARYPGARNAVDAMEELVARFVGPELQKDRNEERRVVA